MEGLAKQAYGTYVPFFKNSLQMECIGFAGLSTVALRLPLAEWRVTFADKLILAAGQLKK